MMRATRAQIDANYIRLMAKVMKGEPVPPQAKRKLRIITKPYNREEDRLRPLIIKALRKRGFKVWRIETAIAYQLGIADLWIAHTSGRMAGWVEVKTPTGKQSPEQREFEKLCFFNGTLYFILRSVEEAEAL